MEVPVLAGGAILAATCKTPDGAIVVAAGVAELLPTMASSLVLDRMNLYGSETSLLAANPNISFGRYLTALLLLALAQAFRRGAELAQEVEGLV